MTGLPDKDIALQTRAGFVRHTLVGINLFVQEMFLQFSDVARHSHDRSDAVERGSESVAQGLTLAEQATVDLARQETATVEVMSMKKTATDLEVKVRVNNKAGHSFPSGVSFRRAFLDFEVLDGADKPIWASGATNQFGMITNGVGGAILPSEFFDGGAYQDHHTQITDQGQVQIYEELVKDTEGHFTTSFLSLFNNIKKNRLLPRGWKPDGPHAAETKPHGSAAKDPDYLSGCGCDTIVYKVPLSKVPNCRQSARADFLSDHSAVLPAAAVHRHVRSVDAHGRREHAAVDGLRRQVERQRDRDSRVETVRGRHDALDHGLKQRFGEPAVLEQRRRVRCQCLDDRQDAAGERRQLAVEIARGDVVVA